MLNVSIDLSIDNLFNSWFAFRQGKKPTEEMEAFSYYLEKHLHRLHKELTTGTYRHGGYHTFTVMDNKRRKISVANIRDRVVHRLLYHYLVLHYNSSFHYDVWSCRPNKGLTGAIDRTQRFLRENPNGFVWRTDITKFFDRVDRAILMRILLRKISDPKALWLLQEVIESFTQGHSTRERERERE